VLCATGYNLRWLLRAIVRLGLTAVFFVLAWLRCFTANATLPPIQPFERAIPSSSRHPITTPISFAG
jgi:IS5 family transposase